MYKMVEELKKDVWKNNLGKDYLYLTDLADFDASNPDIKFFSLIQLKPGEEVQYHMHVGESETYFILSGKGVYNDNGNKVDAVPGMVTLTPSGEGHSLKNTGDDMLTFIALIVLD